MKSFLLLLALLVLSALLPRSLIALLESVPDSNDDFQIGA